MEFMKRKEAIKVIFDTINQSDVTVSTTGLISREIFSEFDSSRNIYVPGSMGLVSSIGLAIALCHENKRVIVIDGDASLLMNLGSMVTIGANKPNNLMHIVLDNGAYGSCSEEKSLSSFANFAKIAKDVGYRYVKVVRSVNELKKTILYATEGPIFILAKIKLGGRRDFSRPLELVKIKMRFISFLLSNK
ncbi:MAG: sulfopyruvate decarboxylase subunit beta [Flavobacterium sp.]|nr:sulfopyruvate decarboxylase subunit beta [Flavobacterium sp.]